MKADDYQKYIKKFDKYPDNISLLTYGLGLGGEAGEVQEKIKKLYRDKAGVIDADFQKAIMKEVGDVMWYLAMICSKLNIPLSMVFDANVQKLDLRDKKNMIHGDGDDREEKKG